MFRPTTNLVSTSRNLALASVAFIALVACATQTDSDSASEVAESKDISVVAPPAPPPAPPPPPSMAVAHDRGAAKMQSFGLAAEREAPIALPPQHVAGDQDRDKYEDIEINPVKLVSEEPISTFSIDVDTASYANVRSFLNDGVLPPKDAVRIEELINYFDYDWAPPRSKEMPFQTSVTVLPSPWAAGRQLVEVGIKGYDIPRKEQPPINLTLLVDVSGSMNQSDKLPLAKKALKLLIDQMDADDHISIVVYAGAAGAVLEPTSGEDKAKIIASLDNLSAGGSTAGGEGLRLAYSLAEQNFDKDAVNRVMLLTDGDFNVGVTSDERLEDLVARKRESGVYLSVLGFGRGNYNDAMMQKIAQAGNGMASYIDTLNEARKVLADDMSGSLFPIANDVKIQVEFNPARVAEYRLIGYETRMLNRDDFNNDKVDAGDIGAGHTVTAIYEITPAGSTARMIDESRYQKPAPVTNASDELAFIKLRYKMPGADTSRLVTRPIMAGQAIESVSSAPEDVRFATAVAAFGQLLRGDPWMADDFDYDAVIDLANGAKGDDPFGYRAEFVQLVRLAKTAAAQESLEQPGVSGD